MPGQYAMGLTSLGRRKRWSNLDEFYVEDMTTPESASSVARYRAETEHYRESMWLTLVGGLVGAAALTLLFMRTFHARS